jgi:hypothetical protein
VTRGWGGLIKGIIGLHLILLSIGCVMIPSLATPCKPLLAFHDDDCMKN